MWMWFENFDEKKVALTTNNTSIDADAQLAGVPRRALDASVNLHPPGRVCCFNPANSFKRNRHQSQRIRHEPSSDPKDCCCCRVPIVAAPKMPMQN